MCFIYLFIALRFFEKGGGCPQDQQLAQKAFLWAATTAIYYELGKMSWNK